MKRIGWLAAVLIIAHAAAQQGISVRDTPDGWLVTGTHFRAEVGPSGVMSLRAADIQAPHVGLLVWDGNRWAEAQGKWQPRSVQWDTPEEGDRGRELTLSGPFTMNGTAVQMRSQLRFSNEGNGRVEVTYELEATEPNPRRVCSRVDIATPPGIELAKGPDGTDRFTPGRPSSVQAFTVCSPRGNRLRVQPSGAPMIHAHAPTAQDAPMRSYVWFAHDGLPEGKLRGSITFAVHVTEEERLGRATHQLDEGTWQLAAAQDLSWPPEGPWQALSRPPWPAHHWSSLGIPSSSPCAWYRHSFTPPDTWRDMRIALRFEAVFLVSHIYLNGAKLAQNDEGFLPFEVDITEAVQWGAVNELTIGVIGDVSKAPPGLVIASQHRYMAGIWQPVSLLATPHVRIDDVFVRPSVRRQALEVDVTLSNATDGAVAAVISAQVLDEGAVALALPQREVGVPPGQSKRVTLSAPFRAARVWSPDDPHLYELVVTQQAPLDTVSVGFGFREVWLKGRQFVLNGSPIRLRSCWGHKGEWHYTAASRIYGILKEHNLNCARIHGQPVGREYYDEADRQGFLLIAESGVYQGPVSEAAIEHTRRFIRTFRNHPSIILWSGTNEYGHWKVPRDSKRTNWLVRQRELIRRLDPTRPVQQSGYGETDGGEMMLNIHYPEQNPADVPACFRWPTDPAVPMSTTYPGRSWHGGKPLAIGEHMLLSHACASAAHGDQVYRTPPVATGKGVIDGQAALFSYAVQEYRRQGVCMISPMVFRSLPKGKELPNPYIRHFKEIFRPVCLYLGDYDRQWLSGATVKRTALVCNETLKALSGALRWRLLVDDQVVSNGEADIAVKPGQVLEQPFTFTAPALSERTRGKLELEWSTDGGEYAKEFSVTFWPRFEMPRPGAKLAVYDPLDGIRGLLQEDAVPFTQLTELSGVAGAGCAVLLIGPGALEQASQRDAQAVGEWVAAGGHVICLEQSALPKRFFPIELSAGGPASIAFIRAPGHPLVSGLTDEDMRFWTDEARVSLLCPNKPSRGNAVPLVDVGGGGMERAPLMQIPHGRGSYIVCQLLVARYASQVPAARRLLANMLAWEPPSRGPAHAIGWHAQPSALAQALQWDVQARISWHKEDVLPPPGGVLFMQATRLRPENAQMVRDFAQSGGTVLVHGAGPEQADALATILGGQVAFESARPGPVSILQGPLTMGMCSYDLWWEDTRNTYSPQTLTHLPTFGPELRPEALTDPPGLVRLAVGEGGVVLNQLLWEQAPGNPRALRWASTLLTNLQVAIEGQSLAEFSIGEEFSVDLEPYCNRSFRDETAGDGKGGWMDAGDNDLRELPTGYRTLAGIPFHIRHPGQGTGNTCIVVDNVAREGQREVWSGTTGQSQVTGIRIGRKAARLHLLHGAAWTPQNKGYSGAEIGAYVVRYADGSRIRAPIRLGRELLQWWHQPPRDLPGARLAWHGRNPRTDSIALYMFTWHNPHPERDIEGLDLVTASNPSHAVGLIAVTGVESLVR